MADYNLEKLFDDLLKKKKFDKENSYTSILLKNKNLLAKKIGEESIEVILEYLDNNKNKIINGKLNEPEISSKMMGVKINIDKIKKIEKEHFGYNAFNLKQVTKFEKKYLIKGLREKYVNPILYRKNIKY